MVADEYVRETLRTLRERTGDAYVPLSEVLGLLRGQASMDRGARNVAIDNAWDGQAGRYAERALALAAAAHEIERRWGPGPQCKRCDGTGMVVAYTDSDGAPIGECCDCEDPRD